MYCTIDDLLKHMALHDLKTMTQEDRSIDAPNMDVINALIREADEKIDGYLRGRYPLPLVGVPTLVKSISVNLVRYAIYARRPNGGDLPHAINAGKADAEKMLAAISRGEINLGIAVTKAAQPNQPWRMKAPKRRFHP